MFFLWDSGLSRGETSDWFTLYGNIFGGLIGGFFTYLALVLTLNDQKESIKKEKRPRIDIPYQSINFIELTEGKLSFDPIIIELNNIGGSIAKNIECKLSLPNYDEVINTLEQNQKSLGIDLKVSKTAQLDDLKSIDNKENRTAHLITTGEKGKEKMSLGGIHESYSEEFIGTSIPLTLNHEAKIYYEINYNVSNWINYIVINRNYTYGHYNERELFNFKLDIKYYSDEYGEFYDSFILKWNFKGIVIDPSKVTYQYVLKSTKVNK